jgi:hypothetical protein
VAEAVQSFLIVLVLSQLGVEPVQAWEQLLSTHCRYERRQRCHFMQDMHGASTRTIPSKVR